METKYIDINGYWGILICYDYTMLDYDDIYAICRSFGMSGLRTEESLRVLHKPNTGMTISNLGLRMSVVFISDATDESEWWSTCIHELKHCHDAILEYYGEDFVGEPSAYTIGYLIKRVIEEIAEPCR